MGRALRLFVGAFPPPETAQALHRAVAERLEAAAVRLVPPEEIHLTLRFLGPTDEDRIPDLSKALDDSLPRLPAPELRIVGAGTFPEASRARVLWIGLSEVPPSRGRLSALSAAAGETEVSTPHLTVARPSRGERVEVPRTFRDLSIDLPWILTEVRLVESRLGEKGADRFPSLAVFQLS